MKKLVLLSILFLLTACAGQTVAQGSNTPLPETKVSPPEVTHTPQPLPSEIPPSPIPPSLTPNPEVFAIIDGWTGFLVGGSKNYAWLNADMTAPYLLGGEEYRFFTDNTMSNSGSAIGNLAQPVEDGPCYSNYTVELTPELGSGIKLSGNWDVFPRTRTRLEPNEVYGDVIETYLIEQNVADPEVEIYYIYKIDLEGDGIDEVLITAIHMTSRGVLPPVTVGDYSIIVMRKLIDGDVVTIPLVSDIYFESNEFAYPTVYTIDEFYDLNGDGRLEVVVRGNRWEGRSVSVFDIDGANASRVLGVSCAE